MPTGGTTATPIITGGGAGIAIGLANITAVPTIPEFGRITIIMVIPPLTPDAAAAEACAPAMSPRPEYITTAAAPGKDTRTTA